MTSPSLFSVPITVEPQELIDRLVQACEEQDVLYVVYWLEEMKRQGILEFAIDGRHSWKHRSALSVIALHPKPIDELRGTILRILLVKGAAAGMSSVVDRSQMKWDYDESDLDTWLNCQRLIMPEYEEKARIVLSLPWDELDEWIDHYLPFHPDSDSFTAEGPLPSPPLEQPSYLRPSPGDAWCDGSTPSISKGSLSESDRSLLTLLRWPQPGAGLVTPQPFIKSSNGSLSTSAAEESAPLWQPKIQIGFAAKPDSTTRKRPNPSLLATPPLEPSLSLPPSFPNPAPKRPTRLVRLNLARFPKRFTDIDLQNLFLGINVDATVIHYNRKMGAAFAFIDVPATDLEHCLDEVNGMTLEGRTLRCRVAYDKPERVLNASNKDGCRPRRRRRIKGR